jgi:hypothetical protein
MDPSSAGRGFGPASDGNLKLRAAYILLSALFLGVVSTLGDFVWAHWNVRHRVAYGLAHGAVICLCIGAAIGLRTGRMVPAAIAGPIVGVGAAGVFYLLAPALRWGAMFPAWMLFWICFALVQRQLSPEPVARALARGCGAALLSGLAFYAISGIWTRPSPGGPDYLRHFLSWSFAFLPGFAALFWRPSRR